MTEGSKARGASSIPGRLFGGALALFLCLFGGLMLRQASQDLVGSMGAPRSVRPFRAFVMDDAGILPDSVEFALDATLHALERTTGVQFAVLTMPTCAPDDPIAYKTRVFHAWRLGDATRDDGLLLLVSMEQRRMAIETGYGLEGDLPDGWLGRVIRERGIPQFRSGQPAQGVIEVVNAVQRRLLERRGGGAHVEDVAPLAPVQSPPVEPLWQRILIGTLIALLGLVMLAASCFFLAWGLFSQPDAAVRVGRGFLLSKRAGGGGDSLDGSGGLSDDGGGTDGGGGDSGGGGASGGW